MKTGFRRFSTAVLITVIFLFGAFQGSAGQQGARQNRKVEKSALAGYISSLSEMRRNIPGMQSLFSAGMPRIPSTGMSLIQGGIIGNGVLGDTLSVLTDFTSEIWFDEGSAWQNQSHQSHAYDTEGRRIQTTHQMWFMNSWQNSFRITYNYDGIGTLRKVMGQNWTGGGWADNTSDTLYYDSYGNVVEEYVRIFNGSSWQNFERYFTVFDSAGRPSEYRRETWTGSEWQNVERYLAFYTGGGLMSQFVYQNWGGSDWTNNTRDTYDYDDADNIVEEHDQFWAAGAWNEDTRYLADYDDDNFLIEVVEQHWNDPSWVYESKQTIYNDPDGRATEIDIQYWSGADWVDDGILYHTYDGPNIVEDYYITWNGWTWVDVNRNSYAWQMIITPDETTQKYPVKTDWNLVSVPLGVADFTKTLLFPTASSSAFYFDAGYTAAGTLENGRGYWLKFDSGQEVTMTGTARMTDTIDVSAGWNLVGSIGATITASGVASIPGGLVVSNFFGFDGGYTSSGIIEPGKAYWVKAADAGKLILDASMNVPASARVRIEPTDERPPSPPEEHESAGTLPRRNSLEQNYPNPFNPATEIHFNLNETGRVKITVYNVIGREVAVLVDGVLGAGTHSVSFDGGRFPSGVYFYKMATDDYSSTRRMILLK